ncbi:MAG: hypothetical protein ABR577_18860 [Pyrinomonadaceae bacterium]
MAFKYPYKIPALLCLILSISLASTVVFAQSAETQATENTTTPPQAEAQEREKKALALLDSVITEARSFRLAENRIRVQAAAADSLWPRDEKRARALFKEAMNELAEIMRAIDDTDQQQYLSRIQYVPELRMELLNTIAQRDTSLALDFLRATHQPPMPHTDPNYRQPDPDAQLEMTLASRISNNDPKRALEIARQALAKGVSYELPGLISQLQAKDKGAAQALISDVVEKLRAGDLSTDQQALGVAVNLLQMNARPRMGVAAPPTQALSSNGDKATPLLDQRAAQDLVNLLAEAALKSSPRNYNALMMLRPLMPEIEKYAPQRATALRRKVSEYSKTLDPQSSVWSEYQELIQKGNIDGLLEAATKAPQEMRNTLYEQAAQQAAGKDEVDRARQILNEKVENPAQRKRMMDNLDRQIMWRDAQQGKFERAQQTLAKLRPEERAGMLVQFANTLAAKGDKKLAAQLLQEAQALIGNRAENYQQMGTQLQIAGAYATIEPARSFEIIAPVIDQINELTVAAVAFNGFENAYFKDGELLLQGQSQLSNTIQSCEQQLGALAEADFDAAKSTADKFQRSEARIMARLLIAQSILSAGNETPQQGIRKTNRSVSGRITLRR